MFHFQAWALQRLLRVTNLEPVVYSRPRLVLLTDSTTRSIVLKKVQEEIVKQSFQDVASDVVDLKLLSGSASLWSSATLQKMAGAAVVVSVGSVGLELASFTEQLCPFVDVLLDSEGVKENAMWVLWQEHDYIPLLLDKSSPTSPGSLSVLMQTIKNIIVNSVSVGRGREAKGYLTTPKGRGGVPRLPDRVGNPLNVPERSSKLSDLDKRWERLVSEVKEKATVPDRAEMRRQALERARRRIS